MAMGGTSGYRQGLVDLKTGQISRELFVDNEIYQEELERLFARVWLFVGHESQIANPGDFFVSGMGEESVILCRDRAGKVDGRSVEIQRLIGRSLRAVVDLEKLGERTLWIDCDVLEADGGTRTASINGAYVALRKLHQDVAAFRRFLAQHATNAAEEADLLAAKIVGRWPSGAPLALSPEHDDPALAADPERRNAFLYYEADPKGLKCPLGSHIRRMNPRDSFKDEVV